MKQLHTIQLQILKKLLFAPSLRYSELKPDPEMENNAFDFHLDQMIKLDYIEKKDQKYTLTNRGKEYANRMDIEDTMVKQQAKVGVCVSCRRIINGEEEYLIYTRKKQPFYGGQGFLSGKVKIGEKIEDVAHRELLEETGLTGAPKLIEIIHFRVYNLEGKDLLEDKILYYFNIDNPSGKLIPNEEGDFEWVKESDLRSKVTNHFVSFEEFMNQINAVKEFNGAIRFREIDQFTDKF